jgi:hypothetical protein
VTSSLIPIDCVVVVVVFGVGTIIFSGRNGEHNVLTGVYCNLC